MTAKQTAAKKGRVVFFNGKLVPESEARISIYDSALMFGDVAFEMTRSFNKSNSSCGNTSNAC